MRKAFFTLCVDDYAPEITALTFPLMKHFAKKIGADFRVITERRFSDYPVVYEKFQIYTLGRGYDWIYYLDADAVIHHDMFDVTDHLSRDTVMNYSSGELAGNRFIYDEYFRRDGRHIACGNWFAVASEWCLDLWHPLDDLTLEQAVKNIIPVQVELNLGIRPEHLIDDYVTSRNVARYGLNHTTCRQIQDDLGRRETFFFHDHLMSEEDKLRAIRDSLDRCGLNGSATAHRPTIQSTWELRSDGKSQRC